MRRACGWSGSAWSRDDVFLLGDPEVPFKFEMFALGVTLTVANIPIFTVIQAKVPGRLMGRVMAVLLSLVAASGPVGTFFAGSFAAASSVADVFLVSGVVIVLVEAIGFVVMTELRDVSF